MPDNTPALVVVAAGGLGTRVHGWARFIPKEFYPVAGRPGIARLLEEIAALGPAHVVIVYHPYYEQFAEWGRQVLGRDGHSRYSRVAGVKVPPVVPPDITVSFIPQRGPYGDLTSVLNGADHLEPQHRLYAAFADNLYSGEASLPLLRDLPGDGVAVLASRYDRELSASRGVLITRPGTGAGQPRLVQFLVEKPNPYQAQELEDAYGRGNLLMLEGRAKVTADFLQFARDRQHSPIAGEPKLALALGEYAHDHQVAVVLTDGEVIDLGAPDTPDPENAAKDAGFDPAAMSPTDLTLQVVATPGHCTP